MPGLREIVMAIVGGIAVMGVGMFWYSPLGFGRTWMRLSGIGPERIAEAKAKGMGATYAAAFASAVLLAGGSQHVLRYTDAMTLFECLGTVTALWLGVVVPVLFAGVLWEGRSRALFALNAAHYLAALWISGILWYSYVSVY